MSDPSILRRIRSLPGRSRPPDRTCPRGKNAPPGLAMHPTVKPVALVADAIKDCSRRGDIVLDPFGGSGTTLIAAEKAGRYARMIEFDPTYCDQILRRFKNVSGKEPRLATTNEDLEAVMDRRSSAVTASKEIVA